MAAGFAPAGAAAGTLPFVGALPRRLAGPLLSNRGDVDPNAACGLRAHTRGAR